MAIWKRLLFWNKWRSLIGPRSTLEWFVIRIGKHFGIPEPEYWRVRPRQVKYEVTARLRNSSDMSVFHQIFVLEEYSGLRELSNVRNILDLGANVGFSSAYFLSCFPNSRIVAVEPDKRNVAVCEMNLKMFGARATLIHGAAWANRMRLRISNDAFGDGREWATQVSQPSDGVGDVQAWDMHSLIDLAGGMDVDLLKVDIERAELAVFGEGARKWLCRIRNICIELHGEDCKEVFFRALADFDYELEYFGELTICRGLREKTLTA